MCKALATMFIFLIVFVAGIVLFATLYYVYLIFKEWKHRNFQGLKQCINKVIEG